MDLEREEQHAIAQSVSLDILSISLSDLRCPVEAWLRSLRVPTCPHAACGCRLAFSPRLQL